MVEQQLYHGKNFMGEYFEYMPLSYTYMHYGDIDLMFCFDIYQDYGKTFLIHLN